MVNFEDVLDEYCVDKRFVAVSVGNSERHKGIIVAKGEDYIRLFGQYDYWIIPIAKIRYISVGTGWEAAMAGEVGGTKEETEGEES